MSTHPPPPMLAKSGGPATSATTSRARKTSDETALSANATPDATMDQVMAFLSAGRFEHAKRLAAAALERFPEHKRVRKVWSIFDNRGKAKIAPGGPGPSMDEEFEWLKNPPEWAYGKWVALVRSEAVASADTLAEVLESLKQMDLPRQPLIHRIE